MAFAIGQRVVIDPSRFKFAGVAGRIIGDATPHLLIGVTPTVVYLVEFDQPTDDGSGHGPYRAAAIEEESLTLES